MSRPANIFLIGYRGTGKSTVARLLARRLGWAAVDADHLLEEKASRSIRQIFADEGEAGFRDRESALLAELCRGEHQVVATGGGVVLRAENRALLKQSGLCVWMTADAQTLWHRLQQDESTAERRPNLTTGGLAEIEDLLHRREPFYVECAKLVVPTEERTPEEVTEEVWRTLPAICESLE